MNNSFLSIVKELSGQKDTDSYHLNSDANMNGLTKETLSTKKISNKTFSLIQKSSFDELKIAPSLNMHEKVTAYFLLKNTSETFNDQIQQPNNFFAKIPVIHTIYVSYLRISTYQTRRTFNKQLSNYKNLLLKDLKKNPNEISPFFLFRLDEELVSTAALKQCDKERNSQIAYSVQHEEEPRTTMVDLLMKHGADINGKNKKGNTALHYAAIQNDKDLVTHLLKNGAKINSENDCEETPLNLATRCDSKEALLALNAHIAANRV